MMGTAAKPCPSFPALVEVNGIEPMTSSMPLKREKVTMRIHRGGASQHDTERVPKGPLRSARSVGTMPRHRWDGLGDWTGVDSCLRADCPAVRFADDDGRWWYRPDGNLSANGVSRPGPCVASAARKKAG